MKIDRKRIVKYIVIFIALMIVFTLINNKINYLITPRVYVTSPQTGELYYKVTAQGIVIDGGVVFNLGLEQDGLLNPGDVIGAGFANVRGSVQLRVTGSNFDPDSQEIQVICNVISNHSVYEGQRCTIEFTHSLGRYELVVPASAVIYEQGTAYIYKLATVRSVLGESIIVRKTEIQVLETDGARVAIEGGTTNYDSLVVHSVKPLRNEMKVRTQ